MISSAIESKDMFVWIAPLLSLRSIALEQQSDVIEITDNVTISQIDKSATDHR